MSIKMVPGYAIPSENGLDYQGYGRFGDTVAVRGQGRLIDMSGLGMQAFYGAHLEVDPLYATTPDPAYGDYGCCGQRPMSRFRGFGAAAPAKGSSQVFASRAEYTASREVVNVSPIRNTAGTATETSGGAGSSGGPTADSGAQPQPVAEPFSVSPLMIGGLAAVGLGLFMMFNKKKGKAP